MPVPDIMQGPLHGHVQWHSRSVGAMAWSGGTYFRVPHTASFGRGLRQRRIHNHMHTHVRTARRRVGVSATQVTGQWCCWSWNRLTNLLLLAPTRVCRNLVAQHRAAGCHINACRWRWWRSTSQEHSRTGPGGLRRGLPTTETWADGLDLVWSVVKPFSTVDDKAGAGELRDDLAAKPAVSHREMEPREARPTQNRLGGRSRSPDATDTLLRKYNQAPPAERNVCRPRCYPRPCDMPRRLRIHLVQCARREEPGAAWQKISVWVTLGAGLYVTRTDCMERVPGRVLVDKLTLARPDMERRPPTPPAGGPAGARPGHGPRVGGGKACSVHGPAARWDLELELELALALELALPSRPAGCALP